MPNVFILYPTWWFWWITCIIMLIHVKLSDRMLYGHVGWGMEPFSPSKSCFEGSEFCKLHRVNPGRDGLAGSSSSNPGACCYWLASPPVLWEISGRASPPSVRRATMTECRKLSFSCFPRNLRTVTQNKARSEVLESYSNHLCDSE